MERLQKILSHAGVASRRAAEEMIRSGRVAVDGAVVTQLGNRYDAMQHEIMVDGVPIKGCEQHVYILLNKPRGYISTAYDERGRRTVLDLLPPNSVRLYPVGRLDADTEGVLLITNDGEMTQGLLHPRFEIDKVYHAEVVGSVTMEKLNQLRHGILLEDGMTAPAGIRLLSHRQDKTVVEVILHEGRNRQVRRMFAAIGCRVCALRRVRFGALTLKGLSCGSSRHLTADEVRGLQILAGVKQSEADCGSGGGACGHDGGNSSSRVRRECCTSRKDAACRVQDDDYREGALQRHKRR